MAEDFVRYLNAKISVDDSSLNRQVFAAAKARVAPGAPAQPTRVLDLGAGTCSMLVRAVEWGLLRHAHYVAVDSDAHVLAAAREHLVEWSKRRGSSCSARDAQNLNIVGGDHDLTVQLVESKLETFTSEKGRFDLLIANAFFDLVDAKPALQRIRAWLADGAHFWLTVNFDGETIFTPEFQPEPELERRLLRVYHRSMDERSVAGAPSGDSRTGRKLFTWLRSVGASIEAAGASDWVIFGTGGRYPEQQRTFLEHIIDTMEAELHRHDDVDKKELTAWLAQRRAQVESGELVYIAHQLDFFGTFLGA